MGAIKLFHRMFAHELTICKLAILQTIQVHLFEGNTQKEFIGSNFLQSFKQSANNLKTLKMITIQSMEFVL